MKIFVTSDTHRDLTRVLEMYGLITGDTPEGLPHIDRFDAMIHCGDLKPDAYELAEILGLETRCVYGNCDGVSERLEDGRDLDFLDTPAGKIMITHGDLEGVNSGHTNLLYLTEQEGCSAVCYGHTHIPVFHAEDGIMIVNPGSPTKPLDGTEGSCAILIADESGFSGQIVYYSDCRPFLEEREKTGDGTASPEEAESMDADMKSSLSAKGKEQKKKPQGGFLRKIMNWADGQ